MSAMVMDVRPVAQGNQTLGRLDAGVRRTHPRGQGFRVLSRMARELDEDVVDYAPRHRRAVTVDVRASIAI
jgi:hypothetical protein